MILIEILWCSSSAPPRREEALPAVWQAFAPTFMRAWRKTYQRSAREDLRALGLEVEEVERFMPIGFQTTPQKMLKITTHDPKEVRSLRERAKEVAGIKAVYETDILFKNRFLIDCSLGGMGWVDAPIPEWTAGAGGAAVSRLCPTTDTLLRLCIRFRMRPMHRCAL